MSDLLYGVATRNSGYDVFLIAKKRGKRWAAI